MKPTGGKRPGAGRKPGAKTLLLKDMSAEILAQANPRAIWNRLLESKDEKIVLDAVKYLTDRVWGKPLQSTLIGNPDGSNLVSSVSINYVLPGNSVSHGE
jgi:hypothetical protein